MDVSLKMLLINFGDAPSIVPSINLPKHIAKVFFDVFHTIFCVSFMSHTDKSDNLSGPDKAFPIVAFLLKRETFMEDCHNLST